MTLETPCTYTLQPETVHHMSSQISSRVRVLFDLTLSPPHMPFITFSAQAVGAPEQNSILQPYSKREITVSRNFFAKL